MRPSIRVDIEKIIRERDRVAVELGCGAKRVEDRITVTGAICRGWISSRTSRKVCHSYRIGRWMRCCRRPRAHENFENLMRNRTRAEDDGTAHLRPHFPIRTTASYTTRPFGLPSPLLCRCSLQRHRKCRVFYTRISGSGCLSEAEVGLVFAAISRVQEIFRPSSIYPLLRERTLYIVPCDGSVVLNPRV
jgi:hypothetical protein